MQYLSSNKKQFEARYLEAMSRIPDPVFIVTTSYRGLNYGFTATSFTSISSNPPTISVCINRSSTQAHAFQDSTSICVNLLGIEHNKIANIFAGKAKNHCRFENVDFREFITGSPALNSCLMSLDCEVVAKQPIATHLVIFGKVVAIEYDNESTCMDALLYGGRGYLNAKR